MKAPKTLMMAAFAMMSLVGGPAASATPARVIVMRHAEKPEESENRDLSAAGFSRARKLPKFILQNFGTPDFLIATAPSVSSDRPLETLLPLAAATGLTTDNSVADKDFQLLANKLLTKSKYDGKLVVIAWHHKKIPKLVAALVGAPSDVCPDPWPEPTFDLIIDITFGDGGTLSVAPVQEPF